MSGERPSGSQPRVFFDGDEAKSFLAQHKTMAAATESMAKSMRDDIQPQLKTIGDRLGVLELGEQHAAGDRAELARVVVRVDKIEKRLDSPRRSWLAALGVTAISIVTATAAIAIAHTLFVP